MALIKGMLLSFSDPLLGLVPTIVAFQYKPTEVTRVLSVQASASGSVTRCAPLPAREQYQLRAEFDATDGLERGGPLTTVLGVAPRLAAIEMLVQPVGSSLLGGLVGSLLGGGGGAEVPVAKLPVVLFSWGPGRLTPVTVTSLTIRETGFDALLNPIHASVDLALTVQRKEELPADEQFARAAADVYQGAREVKAVLQLPQMLELGG